MKKLILILSLFCSFIFAIETEKNPWSLRISGNSFFAQYQLEEESSLPAEFGNMDTTKQNFLMRLFEEELVNIYYSSGFFSVNVQLHISKDTTDSKIENKRLFTFLITEGERYRFGKTRIVSDSIPTEIKIDSAMLNSEQNALYSQEKVSAKMQQISNIYLEQGYLHSTVSYMERIDTVAHTVNLDIYILPGTQVRMGNISSKTTRSGDKSGTAGLSDTAWLNNLWRIPQGEILNGKQSASFKSKLFSTQLFTQVRMQDSLRADGLSDMHLYIQERVPGEIHYNVFYEQLYGFGAGASTRHRNFFGHFHEFGAGALIAMHKQEVSLHYAHPLLFGTAIPFIPTAIRFENSVLFNHEKITPPAYPDSLEERYEVIDRANLTFGFSKNIRFRGTLDLRYVQKNEEKLFKTKLESALTFDFTNDFFNPTKGVRIMPTVGIGSNFGGGVGDPKMIGNPYTYGELTTNLYFPIFGPLFGALSGSCGSFFNKAIEDDARFFYQGGSRTVRGYRFRSIYASYTSIDAEGEEVINTGLTPLYWRLNEELRFTIPFRSWKNWQIVQFFDWAYVTDKESDIYKSSKRASLGMGIRYHWQFLTFRLDYAFEKRFDKFGPEEFTFNRIAFDLSQAF